jgi:glycosyltransferase involved in cell wall biosynthesis
VTHISVFVPAYNCEAWIERCLRRLAGQDHTDLDVVLVDDASSDDTGEIMDWYAGPGGFSDWRVIHNKANQKMPMNLAVHGRQGDYADVVFLLDGDDFLPHEHVLSIVAEYYDNNPDLWLTYGSYTREDPDYMPNPALAYPAWVIEQRNFRAYSSTALLYNHPLTFRRWLFNKVTDDELKDDEGAWFTRCYDHTLMMPMLELAAHGHFEWLPDILYVYNEENPTSEAGDGARAESDRIHRQVNARPIRLELA